MLDRELRCTQFNLGLPWSEVHDLFRCCAALISLHSKVQAKGAGVGAAAGGGGGGSSSGGAAGGGGKPAKPFLGKAAGSCWSWQDKGVCRLGGRCQWVASHRACAVCGSKEHGDAYHKDQPAGQAGGA